MKDITTADASSETTGSKSRSRDHSRCPECDGRIRTNETAGERVCGDCGVVIEEDRIDHGPEWHNYDNDSDDKSRVGAPTTQAHHDKGLSTNISWENKDAYGNELSSEEKRKMSRLRKWNKRFQVKNRTERANRKGIIEIRRMSSALGLPDDVVETAAIIFKRASGEGMLVGRSIEAIATAATYLAAQTGQVPRTFEEFAQVSRVEKVDVRRASSYINKELNLQINPVKPVEYIPRFGNRIDVSEEVITEAKRLSSHICGTNHASGKKPSALAATALYTAGLVLEKEITQREISNEGMTCESTIRNLYKLFLDADPQCEHALEDLDQMTAGEICMELNSS